MDWNFFFKKEKKLSYFQNIFINIKQKQSEGFIIYPEKQNIFNAFRYTSFNKIKVVIIGQDPYYLPKQAHGFCFSVPCGTKIPPSLINIYKELISDIPNFKMPKYGCLLSWATQGILLLNCILTVTRGIPNSHANIGWEIFTNKIIHLISSYHQNIIFLLWGTYANKKINIIDTNKHYVLQSSHPSPLSAHLSFSGCKHFSKTNRLLINNNKKPIIWQPDFLHNCCIIKNKIDRHIKN